MFLDDRDGQLRMKWALVCSVEDENIVDKLSEFSSWFLGEVTRVAAKVNIYTTFEERPKAALRVPVGDYDACVEAYETIRRNWPSVTVVIHILPAKNSSEYEWMRALSSVHGFVRQGVLLENALDRFASVSKPGGDPTQVFLNVAQWMARASSKLCLEKDPAGKPIDICVAEDGSKLPLNWKIDQDVMNTAVNTVLSGPLGALPLYREESAVYVTGYPSYLNEFGIAQLFHGLKVTGVAIKSGRATVTFATKFLAYQACLSDGKQLDRVHTLRVEPVSHEVKEQLAEQRDYV
ncbi:hypothetical protein Q1695_008031 [Nippostrongylus brasiliensis]|nr:hypothetical protein Q1695_008031 [Nippostrongylus brasiliensis]